MIGLFSHKGFEYLDALWGPHMVDRFANDLNAQLSVSISKYYCNGTAAMDAFSQCWGRDTIIGQVRPFRAFCTGWKKSDSIVLWQR
jgi:hypothetical protein